jgi:NADPH:quinone reductase-like Zn-dependent oxidoreductase
MSRSRKVVISNMKAANLQPVIDLAATGQLLIPIAKTVSLAEAPALLASLEQGKRLNGKAVIEF